MIVVSVGVLVGMVKEMMDMLCIIGFFEYFGFCCRLVCIDELLDLWVVVYLGGLGWVNKFLVVSGDIYMWFVFDGFVVVVSGE